MGKKYIIELEDKPFHKGDGDFLYRAKGFNSLVFDMTGFGNLTPYTAPDLEQVREEAYRRGLNDATEGKATCEFCKFHYADTVDEPCVSCRCNYLNKFRPKQEEQIQVGDEVKNTQTDARFIVTHMWVNNRGEKGVSGFNYECSAFSTALELVRKTGRHFPEIAEVLRKMKEDDE